MVVDKYQKVFLKIKYAVAAAGHTMTDPRLAPEQSNAIWRLERAKCHYEMDLRDMKILGKLYGVEVTE